MNDIKQLPTGALSSTDADDVRFDLISPIALERIARTYAEGAKRYGEHNWLKGIPSSDLLNRALRHINLYLQGDKSEDHLAHAAWNIFAIMHFEETRPELIDIPYTVSSILKTIVVNNDTLKAETRVEWNNVAFITCPICSRKFDVHTYSSEEEAEIPEGCPHLIDYYSEQADDGSARLVLIFVRNEKVLQESNNGERNAESNDY